MKRREFITLLGGAAAAWPLAARAQQAGKLPTIGFLGSGTPTSQRTWITAFVERLRELGWIEGRTITIVYRWAEGRPERFVEIAGEFVQLKVDVIFAVGTEAALAMKEATSVIPIVFPVAGDPVGTGLVGSLAHPAGKVTGLSKQALDLGRKRLEILREVLPGLSRLAIMANAAYTGGAPEIGEVRVATRNRCRACANRTATHGRDHTSVGADQGSRRGALRRRRPPDEFEPLADQHLCTRRAASDYVRAARICRNGWADVVWTELSRPEPARRRLCRQNFAWDETGRYPSRAAD
jgi:hypothetical protein